MRSMIRLSLIAALCAFTTLSPVAHATPANAVAERIAPDRLKLSWTDANGVDVYMADQPDATAKTSKLVSANDRDGSEELTVAPGARPYFLLRDRKDGKNLRVAERLLPLEQGSNFRDIGGYPAAGGRRVKWGLIFRSGATPMLTDADLRTVDALHLANLVDLRSDEERQLAPTRIEGVPYNAVGYSMAAITHAMKPAAGQPAPQNGGALYRQMPEMLAPQFRLLFARLLERSGPVAYNCSAGQDRTGLATGLILSALGVPRDVIIADYHLSTQYRRPEYEMASFDPAAFPNNVAAQMFAHYKGSKPTPLKEADGTAFLSEALDQIDKDYGSVDAYLDKKLGVSAVDIAALRAAYTE
jgi:protein-tyrosine phosphatase